MMFEKCLTLLEDLDKSTRKNLLESAKKMLLEYGQPLEEADEILSAGECHFVVITVLDRDFTNARSVHRGV